MWFSISDLLNKYQIKPQVQEISADKKINAFLVSQYPFLKREKLVKVIKITNNELVLSANSSVLKNELRMRQEEIINLLGKDRINKIRFI